MQNRDSLAQIVVERLGATAFGVKHFEESLEIVIFGSMSVGLQRPDSDIDVLCVGDQNFRLKTKELDLTVMRADATDSLLWLGSELASHVVEYGTWIKGASQWSGKVELGHEAVASKHHRIVAFLRALANSWFTLEECFRVKYSIKLRRETQRLLLMERGEPVPPTVILDRFWDSISIPPYAVHDRLRRLIPSSPSSGFTNDLSTRIEDSQYRELKFVPATFRRI